MANLTSSSLDDQQERHFIGDLLCEEDVFAQSNPTRIEGPPSNSRLGTGTGVLPSSGPLGPTPNQTFWPEPPPPYSPYTAGPPQWTSINHQPPGMLAPPVATLYGQSPTATAVTRTDFYQAPFNGPAEWDHVTGAPMDAYVQGISYAQHPGMPPMMKPMLRSRGAVNTAVQHHYHNMYQQYHQTLLTAPPNVLPPPPHNQPPAPKPAQAMPLGNGYTPLEQQPLNVSTRPAPRPNTIKQQPNPQMQYREPVASLPPQAVSGSNNICPTPAGKSYRDAASKQQRPSPLHSSGTTAPVRHTSSSSSSGTPQLSARKMTWSQRTMNERHSSGDSVTTDAVQHANGPLETASKLLPPYGMPSTENTKSSSANGRRVAENDFQKITHKKSKGCKGSNKNEQLITTDPDGVAGNQALDASSRFDVLQSLGGQTNATALAHNHTTAPRRSRSSGVAQRDTSKTCKPSFAPCHTQRDGASRLTKERVVLPAEQHMEPVTATALDGAVTKANAVSQRSVAKKLMLGARRELNEPNTVEPPQRVATTRKQRVAARKRRNTTLDSINYVLLLVLSLLKRGAEWIADLVIDIFLQLRDITVYATLAAYTNVTLSCQRSWYSSWERLRLFWDNLCSFSPSKLWSGDENTSGEWGLSDNIQLPITGEEAMDRLLRCHGQNAYVVLGLRADCSEDDIKRYYKRQAVLVHPDKNHLNGADEAFKILSRAFDAIGSPEARQKYNLANLHKNPLHNEMEELWERLREKMNEARNTMHCDCGSKHARVQVDGVRACEARYCKKCRVRHPAKHNDIWAETRCGGFWWVYYACLDGAVYDITQWATCPNNRLKHMKANSHAVQYRLISTTVPSGSKGDTSSRHSKRR